MGDGWTLRGSPTEAPRAANPFGLRLGKPRIGCKENSLAGGFAQVWWRGLQGGAQELASGSILVAGGAVWCPEPLIMHKHFPLGKSGAARANELQRRAEEKACLAC